MKKKKRHLNQEQTNASLSAILDLKSTEEDPKPGTVKHLNANLRSNPKAETRAKSSDRVKEKREDDGEQNHFTVLSFVAGSSVTEMVNINIFK